MKLILKKDTYILFGFVAEIEKKLRQTNKLESDETENGVLGSIKEDEDSITKRTFLGNDFLKRAVD